MYFNLTSKICSIKFADVSKHFHINVFQDHSRKLHLFFLDVIVPSHSVVWLAFRNWFRKFSQNFNAGHKSATHGWIMDEHPMEQGFGARPSREQRAAYLALGLDSALALHVSRDRTHSSFQHFLLCWSTSSSVFIKMIDDLMLILSTYETLEEKQFIVTVLFPRMGVFTCMAGVWRSVNILLKVRDNNYKKILFLSRMTKVQLLFFYNDPMFVLIWLFIG